MIKKIAGYFGYSLIRKRKSPTLESHLELILKSQQINLVIDVGANIGQFGKMLRKIGYTGEIVSFEPVDSTFRVLETTASNDVNWKVFKLALSDKNEEIYINTFKSSDFASILTPNQFGEDRFESMRIKDKEKIQTTTLDSIFPEEGISGKKILLKMDTQGYDLQVFKGGHKFTSHVRSIISEISFQPIYDGMPNYREVLGVYEAQEFAVTGLYPVTRNKNLSIIEMDCVLIKM